MFLCVVYHRRAVTKSSLSFLGIHFHVIESRSELSSPRQQNRSAGTLTTFSFLTAIELMLNRWQKGIFPANRCVAQYVVVAPLISRCMLDIWSKSSYKWVEPISCVSQWSLSAQVGVAWNFSVHNRSGTHPWLTALVFHKSCERVPPHLLINRTFKLSGLSDPKIGDFKYSFCNEQF